MPSEESIVKELKKALRRRYSDATKDVILFGSRAAGTAHEDSDYDILVVVNRDYDWQFREKVSDIVYDLELKYDILIDQFLISTHELQSTLRGAQPVFVHAIENGVYA